ncbi:MAG: hypothetical protein ACOC97_03205 [Myxococcota bacterium]
MTRCATCGNEYDGGFEIVVNGERHAFDCFECAIHRLAPTCGSCGIRVLGHGVQAGDRVFCSSHCARQQGVSGVATHV